MIFGLAPARHALGADLAPMLHGANATADRKRFRLRNSLVTAQVALSLMLVVTAFLFLRSLEKAAHTDPGFTDGEHPDCLASMSRCRVIANSRPSSWRQRFKERLRGDPRRRVGGERAHDSAARQRLRPRQRARARRHRAPRRDGRFDADWDVVSPEYFETIDMPIVEGRAFRDSDRDGAPWVAIVSETFARQAWPGQSASAGVLHAAQDDDDEERPVQIVGVARDAKYRYISSRDRAVHLRADGAAAATRDSSSTSATRPDAQVAPEIRDGDGAGRTERADRHAAVV